MRLPIAAAAAVAAAASAASAQPACVAGTLASYLALGSSGCTIGTVAVAQFAVAEPLADPGRVTLAPYSRAEGAGNVVGFTVAFAAPLSVTRTFTGPATGEDSAFERFRVDYTITAGAGDAVRGLRGDEIVAVATRTVPYMVGSGGAGATGAVGGTGSILSLRIRAESECAVMPGVCTGNTPQALNIGQQVSLRGNLFAAVSVGTARFGYTEPSPNTMSATLASFRGGYYVAPFEVVPEPGTWAMLGAGLLAVGAAARWRRTGA